MGKVTKPSAQPRSRRRKPAMTPEAREQQLINLAYDLAEQRLLDGTASASEVTQLLKQGSLKNQIELEKLRRENELLTAKTEALESSKNIEALYLNAINAMKAYSGHEEDVEEL